MEAPIQCTYKTPDPITYLTDDIGNECVDFIRRHKNEAFFLYACFNAPHGPMQALDDSPHSTMHWKYTVSAAIREGDWKLIRLPDRLPMLYNISEDISELNDLSFKEIEKTKTLLKKLGEWDINLPHPVFMEPNSRRIRHLARYDEEYQLEQPGNN